MADTVQTVLGVELGLDQPLMAAGLDSLGATELQQSLADSLGIELPSTLVFDYPTIDAITEYLVNKISGVPTEQHIFTMGRSLASREPYTGREVAVVGAAGHQAFLQEYKGGDATSRVPYGRWDVGSPHITQDGTLPAQVRPQYLNQKSLH